MEVAAPITWVIAALGGARDLVCGLNHALLTGIVSGLGTGSIEAVLDAAGGECCVALRPATRPRD